MRRGVDKFAAACTAISVLCAIIVIVGGWTILDTSARTSDVASLARENTARTRETAALAKAIQNQRKDSIRSNCRAQNKRHANTIGTLNRLIAKLPPGPERARAKLNRKGTVLLLNAIVPHQDCHALVRRSAPTPKAPRP